MRIRYRTCANLALSLVLLRTSTLRADDRAYQHGIDFLRVPGGQIGMIWSSAGNPPTSPAGSWTHDIYYSWITPGDPAFNPVTLISETEAQEPASAAISTDGHIFVTMEDGFDANNEVAQRFGVYDSTLKPVRGYPQMIRDGGHSGHVASTGNRFVVFYSEGWVDGGGVDNLGSGDDVYVAVSASTGAIERTVNIAVGSSTRDWWPVVAGSSDRACLVWQRFVDGKTYADLMVSVVDPATGVKVLDQKKLTSNLKYYTYAVEYLRALDRFLILGNLDNDTGFAYLLDSSGTVKAENRSLPGTVREAQMIVQDAADQAFVAQVRSPTGVMILRVGSSSVELAKEVTDTHPWGGIGTDGIFFGDGDLHIGSLSTKGLVIKIFRKVIDVSVTPGSGVNPGGTNPNTNPSSGTPADTQNNPASSGSTQDNQQGSPSPSGSGADDPAASPSKNAAGCGCGLGLESVNADGLLGCWLFLLLVLRKLF